MKQTFEYKLYSSKKNKYLHKQVELAAEIYNHCIALHRCYYRLYKKYLSKHDLQRHLTKLKKLKQYSHWNELGSQAIQDITDRIDRAYTLFFNTTVKEGKRCAPPSFKKRKKYKSITLKQAGYKLLGVNKIRIGHRVYKFHQSRNILGIVKTVTIKRDVLGDIYLYCVCEVERESRQAITGKSVGLDFGLKVFLTASDGTSVSIPSFYKRALKEVKQANKAVSSKERGSHNRHKAVLNLARCHKHVGNQRKDYHFKLAHELTDTYSTIVIEDLNLKGMQRLWGRKVSDLGFGRFVMILKHMCQKKGVKLIVIDRFYPSSKQCHRCLAVNEKLSLKERAWICPSCSSFLPRDLNAAINIERVGVGTSTHNLGSVRLSNSSLCSKLESHEL